MHDKTVLWQGLQAMARPSLCPWDDYYPRMAQSDFLLGRQNFEASKTYFIRKAPFDGAYALLGGITEFLRQLYTYEFTPEVAEILREQGYKKEFIDYLLQRKGLFSIKVYAPPEGSIFLASEPAVVLEGGLVDVRLAEGMLLNCVNYPSLSMTKWSRVVHATDVGSVLEFARRRAQDEARTTLYAHLGGASTTSNSEIRAWFTIPTVGTMGHEWIQSFGDEIESFDKWLELNPDRPVLLVDTVDTLSSGVPNAITAFKKHREAIRAAGGKMGVRLDSGDLAYIAMKSRRMLDAAGLEEAKIFMTNDLDEYSIQAIRGQIEEYANRAFAKPQEILQSLVWACGTKPGTCWDQPSIGGVAKLSTVRRGVLERPAIKLARDNPVKTSIPGKNASVYLLDEEGILQGCLIHGFKEDPGDIWEFVHPDDANKRTEIPRSWRKVRRNTLVDVASFKAARLDDVRSHVQAELKMLHWTSRRIEKPHTVKVGLSPKLFELRQDMIKNRSLIG